MEQGQRQEEESAGEGGSMKVRFEQRLEEGEDEELSGRGSHLCRL